MAYFKLASNTDDDESFKRIVNKPARGIGNTSLAALSAAAMDKGVTLFRAAFADDLENYGLKAAAVEKIRAFCGQISGFSLRIPKDEAGELAVSIAVESGILGLYKSDTSIEGQSKTANIEELINSVKTFVEEKKNEYFEEMLADSAEDVEISAGDLPTVTLGDFLENVSLLSAVDMEDDEDSDNKVTLMTVHSSKGLEFPYVFVVGLEENLFPSGGSLASENEIEEERRLFYVAMTRAEKAVWLSFASTRMRNGKHEANYPSRFIREIDRKYILNPLETQSGDDSEQSGYAGMRQQYRSQESRPVFRTQQPRNAGPVRTEVPRTSGVTPFRKPAQVVKPRADYDFVPSPVMQLAPGQRIEHNRFGYGIIREITGDAAGKKARIAFDEYGEKILMLNYAKIRIISIDGK